jgi:hypothetical protein
MLGHSSLNKLTEFNESRLQLILSRSLKLTRLLSIMIKEELRDACNAKGLAAISAFLCIHCCELQIFILLLLLISIPTSLALASDSNTGFIFMQGGHYGLQKSIASAGESFINCCSY